MSALNNIYKTLYLNSTKNNKNSICSKPSINTSYNKNMNLPLFKNISLIHKPKSLLTYKRTINKNISKKKKFLEKLKFFSPIQLKNKNTKLNNNNRNNLIFSPVNKNNCIRKKLILTNNSNSNSISFSKASIDKKIHKKIKNENKILIHYKKENNKLSNLIADQKNEIENLKNKHQIYNDRLLLLEKEKEYLIKKIDSYNNTQNQLILLIKLIQNIGIDIGQLIDEYNNSVTIKNSNSIINKSKNENNSLSELDSEFESNSFIPINIEKTKEHKLSKIPIPKLNFDILYQKKEKNIFNNIFKNIHDK